MYLTAQRVRSRSPQNQTSPRTGINAYHYAHVALPAGWVGRSIPTTLEQAPGELVGQHTEVPPGGNTVLSFLELLTPDTSRVEQIGEWLALFESSLRDELDNLASRIGDSCLIQFVSGGDGVAGARQEFGALREQVLSVLNHGEPPPALQPLCFLLRRGRDGISIVADDDSKRRILEAGGFALRGSIVADVASDLEMFHHPVLAHLISAVTGLDLDQLAGLGGIRVVKEEHRNTVVFEWLTTVSRP